MCEKLADMDEEGGSVEVKGHSGMAAVMARLLSGEIHQKDGDVSDHDRDQCMACLMCGAKWFNMKRVLKEVVTVDVTLCCVLGRVRKPETRMRIRCQELNVDVSITV